MRLHIVGKFHGTVAFRPDGFTSSHTDETWQSPTSSFQLLNSAAFSSGTNQTDYLSVEIPFVSRFNFLKLAKTSPQNYDENFAGGVLEFVLFPDAQPTEIQFHVSFGDTTRFSQLYNVPQLQVGPKDVGGDSYGSTSGVTPVPNRINVSHDNNQPKLLLTGPAIQAPAPGAATFGGGPDFPKTLLGIVLYTIDLTDAELADFGIIIPEGHTRADTGEVLEASFNLGFYGVGPATLTADQNPSGAPITTQEWPTGSYTLTNESVIGGFNTGWYVVFNSLAYQNTVFVRDMVNISSGKIPVVEPGSELLTSFDWPTVLTSFGHFGTNPDAAVAS